MEEPQKFTESMVSETPHFTREEELRILFTDLSRIPESILPSRPSHRDLGILAKTLMENNIIDHTFFTKNW